MNEFKIIGFSKPNKVRLSTTLMNRIVELPVRTTRKLLEEGAIQIANPEPLYLLI